MKTKLAAVLCSETRLNTVLPSSTYYAGLAEDKCPANLLFYRLQKLYNRVKDYNPPTNFRQKVKELSLALEENERRQEEEAAKDPKKQVDQKAWYLANEESQELIKQLSAEEELLNFNSPQGLLLHGEV